MTRNPAKLAGRNPQPKAEEIHPFTQAEIDLVAEELGPKYGPAVVFASQTGMRPSEWLAIEWRDVDRKAGVVLVERSCAYGIGLALVCAVALLFLSGAINGLFNSAGDQQQPGGAFTPPVPRSDLEWPTTIADCEDGGWRNYAQFRNERQCKDYVRDITS
jgi:hypothetical protein